RYDAVVSFTAFHWLDPEVRYAKAAALLRAGGALAVVTTKHVLASGGDTFWGEVQDDYDAVVPSDENRPPPSPDEVADLSGEVEASGRFQMVAARRYLWDVSYGPDEYVDVLETYSGHRTIPERQRLDLYARIRRRIEARPEGRVRKTYLAILNLARRL